MEHATGIKLIYVLRVRNLFTLRNYHLVEEKAIRYFKEQCIGQYFKEVVKGTWYWVLTTTIAL